jgi:sugar phosphate permease
MVGKLARGQVPVAVLTFVAYACLHVTRKGLSNVKPLLQKEYGFRAEDLGLLDSLFLWGYAGGLLVSGVLGDRVRRDLMIGFGMLLTAVTVAMMGLGSLLAPHVSNEQLLVYFGAVWCVCGACQGTGWPNNVAVMEVWFPKKHRGKIYGLWSANINTGNIVGGLIASLLLFLKLGWEWCFYVPAIICALWGSLVILFLKPHPQLAGISEAEWRDPDDQTADDGVVNSPLFDEEPLLGSSKSVGETDTGTKKAVNFFRAWLMPGVAMYCCCYACAKVCVPGPVLQLFALTR